MGHTYIRQDIQIRKSDVYDDTVAVGATLESAAVHIEDDLNALRSQAKRALWADVAGNWYDDINTPSALDPGSKRGILELNTQLHLLERKRVLVSVANLTDITVPSAASATGTFTSTGAFSDGETVTIGGQTYTFTSPFVNAANNIDASGTQAQTHENLRRAINGDGVAGTNYGTGTPVNTNVTAADTPTTNVLTAILAGTGGNAVATTTTCANASFGAATLTGGAGDVVVLTAPQLPSNTTVAIGAVTTRGTVAVQNTTFGIHSLAELVGTTTIAPKNLVEIVDGQTRDEILSSNRVVYALFQSESATDGSTLTGTTPNRAMLSFVRINATGDDLEIVPAAHIAGKTINYASIERKALEDLNEQDFLRGAMLDNLGSTTVTRQVAYDNQGTTPVDLTTNATLDLEGAGLTWAVRDDLQANLFRIIEGSAGGTSQVSIDSDVDTFNVDAVVNDFDAGIRVDTGGQRINVGETAGLIESTGANDLRILGAAELYLDDGNQTGSTWAQTSGIKLSDTTTEWDDYETVFGGEVSLLRGIYLAATMGNRGTKTYADVTVTTTANNDVGGVGGGTNLSAQLPDMSGGNFLTDYDVFLNGVLLEPGADATANNDYYPGTSLADGQLMFEYTVKIGDIICVIPYA
jgi:hypothetical protein